MKAWVWGGSSGVGEALTKALIVRSDTVLCLARRSAVVDGVRSEPFDMEWSGEQLRERMNRLLVVEGLPELSADERAYILEHGYKLGWRRFWRATRDGAPDLAIISSGIGAYMRADQWHDQWWLDSHEQRHAGIENILHIDLASRLWVINELIRAMRRRRSGRIVVIGSMMAKRGRGDHAAGVYAAAMRGIEAALDCEATNAGRRNIALCCIRLGWTATPMTVGIVEWKQRAIEKRLGPMLSADVAAAEILAAADTIVPGALHIIEIGR